MRVSGKGLIDRENGSQLQIQWSAVFKALLVIPLPARFWRMIKDWWRGRFKYHRPRGGHDGRIGRAKMLWSQFNGAKAQEPNTRATVQNRSMRGWWRNHKMPGLHSNLTFLGVERPVVTIFGSWVLLQNIHVAAGLLGAGLRAVYSSCGWSWRLG